MHKEENDLEHESRMKKTNNTKFLKFYNFRGHATLKLFQLIEPFLMWSGADCCRDSALWYHRRYKFNH